MLDWMNSNKVSDMATSSLWDILRPMLGEEANLPRFTQVKRLLDKYTTKHVQRIELCPNDCIAYWNSKYLPTR